MSRDASIGYLERIIRHMTGKIRSMRGPEQGVAEPAWWVLVCGDTFDPEDFEQRDRVRDKLRRGLNASGVRPPVYEWVWDETNRVQLVVGRHAHLDEAETQAQELQNKGFTIRIVPSMSE